MPSFDHRFVLILSCVCATACTDDGGENLPGGGFTTGEETGTPTTDTPTTNTPTTNTPTTTSEGTTTDDSDSSTTDPTTTGQTETTDTTTGNTDSDTTTGDTTTGDPTTDPTTMDTGDSSSETTDPTGAAECGNAMIEAAEVCFVDGGTVGTAAGATDVAAGDFDGDGNLDVIVTSGTGGTVSVHLGDGAGGLGAAVTTAVGAAPARVVAGELSGDASWDAIVANADDDTVSVLIASGGGNFTATALTVGDQPVGLSLGDLDGANGLDFAVANAGSVDYHTATNDGSGTFTVLGPWAPAGMVDAMAGIALGRVALGGTIDAFYGGGGFYAATNGNGDGTMSNTSQGGTAGDALGRMDAGDINGDNDMDVAAADGDAARIYLGQGGDGNASFQSMAIGGFGEVSEALLADVTGEGDDDVVIVDRMNAVVAVAAGDGVMNFEAPVPFDVGTQPAGAAVADLNGDTVQDLIVVAAGTNDLTIWLSNP